MINLKIQMRLVKGHNPTISILEQVSVGVVFYPSNCCLTSSFAVIETSNALQAWKILEDLTNHIDLVLTEVSMPTLSGIVLLSKIMSHKTRKNSPVISKC